MKRITCFSLLVFPALMLACTDEPEQVNETKAMQDDRAIQQYLIDNNLSAQKDELTGIYYEVLSANPDGEMIRENDIVSVYYRIKLLDGRVLEVRNSDSGPPLKFLHQDDALYPEGINYGIRMMRKGERFRFYLPGRWSLDDFFVNGFIGPGAILVAEMEVVDIFDYGFQNLIEDDSITSYLAEKQLLYQTIEYPSGLIKIVQKAGVGFSPSNNQSVSIHYTRKYLDDTILRTTINGDPVSFSLGTRQVVPGLEEGLRQMRPGEKALLVMPSRLAFGGHIQVFPQRFRDSFVEDELKVQNVLPFSPLVYEVELLQVK